MVTTTTPLRAKAVAVVAGLGAGAGLEAAAVDPDHHRQAFAGRLRRRPDVEVEAVLAHWSGKTMSGKIWPCMQREPNAVASRTPVHGGAGRGGCQRSSPTGGAAKGMPL